MASNPPYTLPRSGEIWRHFKGDDYVIGNLGVDTETGSVQVSYYPRTQDDEYRRSGPDAVDWSNRRLDVFLGWARAPSGANVRRFLRRED